MQVRVLPEDFIAAFRLHQRPRPVVAVFGGIIVALFVFAIVLSASSFVHGTAEWYDWVGPLGGLYLAAWYWLIVPARLKKLYWQQKAFHEPIQVELRTEGMSFSHIHGAGVLPWAHVHKWRESKDLFLVYHSDALYNVLPKRDLRSPAEIEEVRQALMSHVGPANRSRPAKGTSTFPSVHP